MKNSATKKESLILHGFLTALNLQSEKIIFQSRVKSRKGTWEDRSLVSVIGLGRCNMEEFREEWERDTDSHYHVSLIVQISGMSIRHIKVERILSKRVLGRILAGNCEFVNEKTPFFKGCFEGHFWKQECFQDKKFQNSKVWDVSFQKTDLSGKRYAREVLKKEGIEKITHDYRKSWVLKVLGWDKPHCNA